jgi:hypothetical protein
MDREAFFLWDRNYHRTRDFEARAAIAAFHALVALISRLGYGLS